jgi:hypothetical protein
MGKLQNKLVRFHLNALNNTCLCVAAGDNAVATEAIKVLPIFILLQVFHKKIPSVFQ